MSVGGVFEILVEKPAEAGCKQVRMGPIHRLEADGKQDEEGSPLKRAEVLWPGHATNLLGEMHR